MLNRNYLPGVLLASALVHLPLLSMFEIKKENYTITASPTTSEICSSVCEDLQKYPMNLTLVVEQANDNKKTPLYTKNLTKYILTKTPVIQTHAKEIFCFSCIFKSTCESEIIDHTNDLLIELGEQCWKEKTNDYTRLSTYINPYNQLKDVIETIQKNKEHMISLVLQREIE